MASALANALGEAPRLRMLSIEQSSSVGHADDDRMSRECLAAIGELTELEYLRLENTRLPGDSLACFAGLINLNTLCMHNVYLHSRDPAAQLLRGLPALPRLEVLELRSSAVGDEDLRHLAVLPHLKSLRLEYTDATSNGLAQVAALESLETLEIDSDMVSAAGLESLLALKRLKALKLRSSSGIRDPRARLVLDDGSEVLVQNEEPDRLLRALDALRLSNPGIVVGKDSYGNWWPGTQAIPANFQAIHEIRLPWAHDFLRLWTEGKGELQRFNAAAWRRRRFK